jgi:hypothetical protein
VELSECFGVVEIEGRRTGSQILVSDEVDVVLIDVLTLKALGLEVDPTTGRLRETEILLLLSIPLNGFRIIASHIHCGNLSQFHYMDSIPLSPQLGAPCIWCGVGYLSFSLSFLIGFPMLWMGVSIVYC